MRVASVFASRVLAKNPAASITTAFTGVTIDSKEDFFQFGISILLQAENAEDSAKVKVFLISPRGKNSPIIFDDTISARHKDELLALALNVNMPLSQRAGIYRCAVELNGQIAHDEILFEVKYRQLVPSSREAVIA